MEILPEIKNRKSVRKFLDKEVSDLQITMILKAGMSAPSAINKQPWKFYVVKDEKKKQEIVDALPFGKYIAPVIIIPCIDETKTLNLKAHDLAYCDLGAVTENILIEAVHQGLSTVWCATYPDERRINSIKKILNLDKNTTPYATIFLGYEDGYVSPKDKFDPKRIHII